MPIPLIGAAMDVCDAGVRLPSSSTVNCVTRDTAPPPSTTATRLSAAVMSVGAPDDDGLIASDGNLRGGAVCANQAREAIGCRIHAIVMEPMRFHRRRSKDVEMILGERHADRWRRDGDDLRQIELIVATIEDRSIPRFRAVQGEHEQ